jgi:uncharacterized membrane protein YbhN (UPF0104 family)
MDKRWRGWVASVVGLVVFCVALWILYQQLRRLHLRDVLEAVHQLPASRVSLAFLAAVLNYCVLTGYDALALHYINRSLRYGRIALAAFTSYVFSNNLGLSLVGASAIRYRLYSAWGLSALEIATVVGFSVLTLWLGILTLAGVAFLFWPFPMPPALPLPFTSSWPLGLGFLVFALGYLTIGGLQRGSFKVKGWEFAFPSFPVRAAQAAVGALDWSLAAGVLYFVLPPSVHVHLHIFLGIYLMAQIAGMVSFVPGGLAVFESVFLLLLEPHVPKPEVMAAVVGSLLVYRALYYVLPFCVGALVLGMHEAFRRNKVSP